MTDASSERVTTSSPQLLAEVSKKEHVLGAASPALTLVEYWDFGCRFCYAAHHPVLSLLDRFDGAVFTTRWVRRSADQPDCAVAHLGRKPLQR